jgi:hypothetical protein
MTKAETPATERSAESATTGAARYRWGGAAGFVFVGLVVAQNILRGASAPTNDAAASKIVHDYADHRALHWLLASMFAVGACALAVFVAALWDRLRANASAVYVRIGVLGAALVFALFSVTVAIDIAITSYVHLGNPSPDVVRGLWVLHNGVFTLLLAGLAIALFGFALAAVTGGLIGGVWKVVGVVGALALLTAPLSAPAITEGSPAMAVGLVGFLGWLALVGRTSYALWHEST